MKRYKESDYIIESFDEFMANRFDNRTEYYDSEELDINEFYDILSDDEIMLDERWQTKAKSLGISSKNIKGAEKTLAKQNPNNLANRQALITNKHGNRKGNAQQLLKQDMKDNPYKSSRKVGGHEMSLKNKGFKAGRDAKSWIKDNPGKTALVAGGAAATTAGAIMLAKKLKQRKAEKAAANAQLQPVNASISFAAIGAGAVAHELCETNQTINDNTYLLGFMNDYQIDECINTYYNFVDVYGHNDDFIDECVDEFFEASDNVWDVYESYITEGYDEDDTSIIEESADLIVFAAESVNDLLTEGKKWDKVKAHLKKHKGKYIAGAAAAAVGVGGYAAHKRGVKKIRYTWSRKKRKT